MFKIGDIVEGIGQGHGDYNYTGKGSLSKVVGINGSESITVEIIKSAPCSGWEKDSNGNPYTFSVDPQYFKLSQEKPMTENKALEALETLKAALDTGHSNVQALIEETFKNKKS